MFKNKYLGLTNDIKTYYKTYSLVLFIALPQCPSLFPTFPHSVPTKALPIKGLSLSRGKQSEEPGGNTAAPVL